MECKAVPSSVAVWCSWWQRWSAQQRYSTPGSVSTGMGDHTPIWSPIAVLTEPGVQLSVQEIYLSLTNHPGQLSLAIRLW